MNNTLVSIKSKTWMAKILPAAFFALIFLIIVFFAKEASPNRNDRKLKELQQLATEIPTFPTFRETATHHTSRFLDAGVYKYYNSNANYKEVKIHYSIVLIQKGWILTTEENLKSIFDGIGGKKLTFQKGDLRVTIEYTGKQENNISWNYSVSFLWR